MVATRGKKIDFKADSSDGERDVEHLGEHAPKRRKTKKSDSAGDDTGFLPGPSSAKGKDKATLDQNQLITRRGGRGGKLRDLMNMPIDIFTEVCSYLDPYDLRRLALTSKRLWDILMTKEARHIWKTSLASVPDLPECPTDLNEPQYVCLLYSSECYTIGCTSRGTKADWFHRVRFCTSCYEAKMANEWALRYNERSLGLDFRSNTLYHIQAYFDSSSGKSFLYVMMLARNNHRSRSSRGYMRKTDERHYHVEALKKAGHEYEALSGEEAWAYRSLLQEKRDYRKKVRKHALNRTGVAMLTWKCNQLASRADDIAAEKNARFESIKVKLLEMGWDEKDFPMSNKDFRDLVLKDQKLTPKIWQNIKPKLEPLLETQRTERLAEEKEAREWNREQAIAKFYRQVGQEIIDIPFDPSRLSWFLPEISKVHALPSVKPLLENDTETITEDQWADVAPEVRLIVIKWWRDSLKQLLGSAENGGAGSSDETNEDGTQGGTSSETETEETIARSVVALRARLSSVTSAFYCKATWCGRRVQWFPDLIKHGTSQHSCYTFKTLSAQLGSTQPIYQELIKRLLKDLGVDHETVKLSDTIMTDQTQKNYLCTRCDEKIAPYMNFTELVEHYLDVQKWFDNVTEAVRTSPDNCYPSRTVNSQLPKIVNDHDWLSRDAPLVRQDDEKTKEAVLQLQRDFKKEGLTDPRCDRKGIGGEDLEKHDWREVLHCCRLCPKAFAPRKDRVAHPKQARQGTQPGNGYDDKYLLFNELLSSVVDENLLTGI
ncbi:hypothetical protein FS837_004562 [Tulasnella sp. UAMH 9824]|nr:hypothetical protein FS837_004562 [Tulasnella sp. UAMH 9824]